MTDRKQPGRPVQERSLVLTVMHHRFASMKGRAHSYRPDLTPIFAKQCTLGIERRSHCLRGCRKDRLHRIANDLEEHAIVGLDRRAQEREVALHGIGHRSPVPLPERGAALDVGEQEGDGTAGEIGHRPSP
jgi:hypothetical protein